MQALRGDLITVTRSDTQPAFNNTTKKSGKMKKIPFDLLQKVEREVKALLHASRDASRNRRRDTRYIRFEVGDAYYSEAFGIMRGLQILNYGYFGSDNREGNVEHPGLQPEQNLKWWFNRLERQVLKEEGFNSDHVCEYCTDRYKKDSRMFEDSRNR